MVRRIETPSINIKGHLMNLDVPKIMGILNVTPDSFYSSGRVETEDKIRERVINIIEEGADIIDIGGCSTRPHSSPATEEEELERVRLGCKIIREMAPHIPVSVDTFRESVARIAVKDWEVDIVNDISGGSDPEMWNFVSSNKVPYVLTHNMPLRESPTDITTEVIIDLSKKINELHRIGVNDLIIDPGIGFNKTLEENFKLLDELDEISKIGLPLLLGLSRKSMIYKTLGKTPEESMAGTIALNAIALEKGANILRVHDVKAAVDTVKLFARLKNIA